MSSTASKYCAHCGAELRPGTKFCRNCGKPVQPDPSVTDVASRDCPSCGITLLPEAESCYQCGWTARPTERIARAPTEGYRAEEVQELIELNQRKQLQTTLVEPVDDEVRLVCPSCREINTFEPGVLTKDAVAEQEALGITTIGKGIRVNGWLMVLFGAPIGGLIAAGMIVGLIFYIVIDFFDLTIWTFLATPWPQWLLMVFIASWVMSAIIFGILLIRKDPVWRIPCRQCGEGIFVAKTGESKTKVKEDDEEIEKIFLVLHLITKKEE